MRFRAVLFDLDGTLLDTLEDLADAMNEALAQMNLPPHPVAAYRHFVGDGVVNLARRALGPERSDSPTVQDCVARMRDAYSRCWDRKTCPYDGVPELLDELSRRGLPLAVLSNKPDDFTRLCVERLLPRWRFAAVQGVTDHVPPKPDPAGVARVVERLGVPPETFLYLGDTATDMRTAGAAGMFAVGALWGFRDAEELRGAGAAALIERPEDLLGLL